MSTRLTHLPAPPDPTSAPPTVSSDSAIDAADRVIERQITVRLTTVLALGVLAIGVASIVVSLLFPPVRPTRVLTGALAILITSGALVLLRHGRVYLAAALTLWSLLGVIGLAGVLNGGLEAPAFVPTIALAAFAALVFSVRHACAYCAATVLLVLLMAAFHSRLQLPAPPPVAFRALMYAILSPVVMMLLWSTASLLRTSARQARDEAARRAAAEVGLRESEERVRAIIQGAPGAIITVGPDGGVENWNPRAAAMFGWSEAEMHGRPLADAIAGADSALGATLAAIRAGSVAELDRATEVALQRRDGGAFTAELTVVRLPRGGATVFGVFIRDISAERRARDEISQLNADLDRRVRERTAELALRVAEVERLNGEQQALMRDLRASQQATDRFASRLQELNASLLTANSELEAFSYSVSHDLRAPLRNISGFAELLEQRAAPVLDAESRRFVETIRKEARRLGTFIDSLLKFSSLGRAELAIQAVDLHPLVDAVRVELAPQLEDRTLEWQVAPLPRVQGDASLLRQVFANLLGNSVKFTRLRPDACVEIGATADADPGFVTIFVRDNGAGFNPKYAGKLFGVFKRLHNVTEFEGTGIGLANVKRIVTRHGGRVWAEGTPGQGATFFFTLRLA